jgi:hypothetical protein
MTRFLMMSFVVAAALGGVAQAQQAARQPAPRTTRSYRSYSVAPAPRGDVRRDSTHASEATWRHASSKPAGHYGGGR